jgi:hypothetical protein
MHERMLRNGWTDTGGYHKLLIDRYTQELHAARDLQNQLDPQETWGPLFDDIAGLEEASDLMRGRGIDKK